MVAKMYGFRALRSEVCRGNSKGDIYIGFIQNICDYIELKAVRRHVRTHARVYGHGVRACVRVHVHACVRACIRACVRACMRVRVGACPVCAGRRAYGRTCICECVRVRACARPATRTTARTQIRPHLIKIGPYFDKMRPYLRTRMVCARVCGQMYKKCQSLPIIGTPMHLRPCTANVCAHAHQPARTFAHMYACAFACTFARAFAHQAYRTPAHPRTRTPERNIYKI